MIDALRLPPRLRLLRRGLRRLCRRTHGIAAVEFAIALPFMLTLYMGGYVLSDMIACNRKVTVAARELTDLTSRSAYLTQSDAATILGAATQVLAPYDQSRATERLSEVMLTDTTHAKVIWSQSLNGTALTAGTVFVVPSGLGAANAYLILGEITYAYRPTVGFYTATAMNFYDKIYMSPRLSQQIPLQ